VDEEGDDGGKTEQEPVGPGKSRFPDRDRETENDGASGKWNESFDSKDPGNCPDVYADSPPGWKGADGRETTWR